MNRWKLAVPFVAVAAAAFTSGCVVEEQVPVQQAPQPVEVQSEPPPDQYEVVPVAPRADYVWINGHWDWGGARYVWVPGRYELPRRGYRWVRPHYERRAGRAIYVRGHWGR